MDTQVPVAVERPHRVAGPAGLLAVGAIAGVAWAAALRALMGEIAGDRTSVTWSGTFAWILLPALVTGLLLGWAEHLRRIGGRPGWRWLALAPLLLAAVLLSDPLHVGEIFEDGIGGGAIGVPVIGMIGGYAISGRGRLWGRLVAGAVFCAGLVVWALTATSVGGPTFALTTPHGAWVTVLYYTLLLELAVAAAIPHRHAGP